MAALIPVALAAAPALIGAAQKQQQSAFEQGQAEIQAKQLDLQVVQREADRKDRLASALASQNALSGASGVESFSGSPLSVLQDSIEREKVGTERDVFSSELQALSIRSGGRIRRKFSEQSTALNLLQTLRQTASSTSFGGG